jgi:transcriptional regulator with XRE-family HTH domain
MDSIASTFRNRRLALGITQEQAAKAAALARRTLIAFESGEGRISLANLRRLMAVVGLELSTREATRRPTLDELSSAYTGDDPAPSRKRARRKRSA